MDAAADVTRMLEPIQRKLSLVDEFPPDQQAVDAKLQALALEVEAMEKIYRKACDRYTSASEGSDTRVALRAVDAADKNRNERLTEFVRVYLLVQDFLPAVVLLFGWRDYARQYHDEVEPKKPQIKLGGKK